jgi:hypothetical protein
MVLSTGIEPIHKTELIQRTLIIPFSSEYKTTCFSDVHIVTDIQKNRDLILSAFIKIAFDTYKQAGDYDTLKDSLNYLISEFPNHPKERSNVTFSYMFEALKHITRHIKKTYWHKNKKVDPFFVAPANFNMSYDYNKEVLASWITSQADAHMEIAEGTNEIVQFLETLYSKWNNCGMNGEYILNNYGINIITENDIFIIKNAASEIHWAFGLLAKEGTRYPYTSHTQMSRRIMDSKRILMNCGWIIGHGKKSGARFMCAAKFNRQSELDYLLDEVKFCKWKT